MWKMEYYSRVFPANKILSERKRLPVKSLTEAYRNTGSSIGQFTKFGESVNTTKLFTFIIRLIHSIIQNLEVKIYVV